MTTETEQMVRAAVLAPYIKVSRCACSSCGTHTNFWDRFLSGLKSGFSRCVTMRYCGGGKEPTESRGMIEAMMTGERDNVNPCAGIYEPHLHLKCMACGFEWLMKTKESGR